MASVAIRDVHKAFGATAIIHGVDISIRDGEFVVLVGPSGCGKSTLLRMIAGLENITAGEIHIGDRVVNNLPPKERDIAMVFQNYALYPHMTVARQYGLLAQAARRPQARDRARGCSAPPRSSRSRPARTLSRASFRAASASAWPWAAPSCAIRRCSCSTSRCRISMPSCACRCASRSRSCTSALKTTTIYVTHDQIEAMTMADRIVVMRDGLVEQIGAPLELYDRPDNLFVAGFIGSPADELPQRAVARERQSCCSKERPGRIHACRCRRSTGSDGRTAVYGVRPEHFALADDGSEAVVQVIEPTGSELQVVAKLGGEEIIAVFRERHQFRPGDKIRLKPRSAARAPVRRDDRKTSRRISPQTEERP